MSPRDPPYSHLTPAARELLQLDDAHRILALRADRWIDYPRAVDALARLQRLLDTPRRERMPCMLIHGGVKHRQDADHREVPA